MDGDSFELVSSFDIDDGQLDGLSLQQSFVLGYELAQIDSLLSCREPFERPVHVDNRERISRRCRSENRDFSMTYMQDDKSESWLWLRCEKTNE